MQRKQLNQLLFEVFVVAALKAITLTVVFNKNESLEYEKKHNLKIK